MICVECTYNKCHVIVSAGYVDIDCGLREGDVPSVRRILESPACCYMDCDDDNDDGDDSCPAAAVRCSQVGLSVVNAIYNATCRFVPSTVMLTDLYVNILDHVPPIHVTANNTSIDPFKKLTCRNGGMFTKRSD